MAQATCYNKDSEHYMMKVEDCMWHTGMFLVCQSKRHSAAGGTRPADACTVHLASGNGPFCFGRADGKRLTLRDAKSGCKLGHEIKAFE